MLRAYQHWGESCPEHLIGDFALVIWDGRRQQLFCARDILGLKPFVLLLSGDNLLLGLTLPPLFETYDPARSQ